jgi:hypothetical protein
LTNHTAFRNWVSSNRAIILVIAVVSVCVGHAILERQAMKRVIVLMARSFQRGAAPDMALFTSDAVFKHENLQSPCDMALEMFAQRAAQYHAFGDIYVQKIEAVSCSMASIKTTSWFSINGSSYEASGIVVLKKLGLFRWRIASVSSDYPAFRELFFDAASNA